MTHAKLMKDTIAGIDEFLPRWRVVTHDTDLEKQDLAYQMIDALLDMKLAAERYEKLKQPAAA